MEAKTKFKVGDRVRVVDDMGGGRVGDIATITKVYPPDGYEGAFYEMDGLSHGSRGLYERRLELAPLFAVGDRVRLTEDNDGYGEEGDTGTVIDVGRDDADVRIDDGGEWYVPFTSLEHITDAPLTIRAGAYYKTRDGRKVGPVEEYDGQCIDSDYYGNVAAFYVPHRGSYTEGGKWLAYKGDSDHDLIAEWPAEPAVVAASATDPKFKVGDRVRRPWSCVTGTIKRVDENSYHIDYGSFGYRDFVEGELVLAAGKAIVARIDNGQPKPASAPYVHVDTASAKAEAARLARVNPGREFGVYELVDTVREAKVYDHEWQRLAASGKRFGAAYKLNDLGIPYSTAMDIVEDFAA